MDDETTSTGEDIGGQLADDELSKVSGGIALPLGITPVRISISPIPNLGSLPDVQHGDPHVDE